MRRLQEGHLHTRRLLRVPVLRRGNRERRISLTHFCTGLKLSRHVFFFVLILISVFIVIQEVRVWRVPGREVACRILREFIHTRAEQSLCRLEYAWVEEQISSG